MDILPSTPTVASLSLTLQLLFLQFFRCITWGIFPSTNLVHCEDSSYVAQIFVSPFFLFFFIMEFRKQYVTFILLFCFIFWSSMTLCVLLFVFSVLYVSFLFCFFLICWNICVPFCSLSCSSFYHFLPFFQFPVLFSPCLFLRLFLIYLFIFLSNLLSFLCSYSVTFFCMF